MADDLDVFLRTQNLQRNRASMSRDNFQENRALMRDHLLKKRELIRDNQQETSASKIRDKSQRNRGLILRDNSYGNRGLVHIENLHENRALIRYILQRKRTLIDHNKMGNACVSVGVDKKKKNKKKINTLNRLLAIPNVTDSKIYDVHRASLATPNYNIGKINCNPVSDQPENPNCIDKKICIKNDMQEFDNAVINFTRDSTPLMRKVTDIHTSCAEHKTNNKMVASSPRPMIRRLAPHRGHHPICTSTDTNITLICSKREPSCSSDLAHLYQSPDTMIPKASSLELVLQTTITTDGMNPKESNSDSVQIRLNRSSNNLTCGSPSDDTMLKQLPSSNSAQSSDSSLKEYSSGKGTDAISKESPSVRGPGITISKKSSSNLGWRTRCALPQPQSVDTTPTESSSAQLSSDTVSDKSSKAAARMIGSGQHQPSSCSSTTPNSPRSGEKHSIRSTESSSLMRTPDGSLKEPAAQTIGSGTPSRSSCSNITPISRRSWTQSTREQDSISSKEFCSLTRSSNGILYELPTKSCSVSKGALVAQNKSSDRIDAKEYSIATSCDGHQKMVVEAPIESDQVLHGWQGRQQHLHRHHHHCSSPRCVANPNYEPPLITRKADYYKNLLAKLVHSSSVVPQGRSMTKKPTYNTTDHHNVNTLSHPNHLTITSHVGENVDTNDHCCKDKYILNISNTTAAAAATTTTTTTTTRSSIYHHLSTSNITKMLDQGISMDRITHECDVADADDDKKSILSAKNHDVKQQLSDTITLKTHECDDDDQKPILSMHNYNDKYMGLGVWRRRNYKLESSGFPEPSSECILEKMWLRKQEVEARKEAEEWMLDCALQHRLMISDHQTKIRSVKAIVEAFENVMHINNGL